MLPQGQALISNDMDIQYIEKLFRRGRSYSGLRPSPCGPPLRGVLPAHALRCSGRRTRLIDVRGFESPLHPGTHQNGQQPNITRLNLAEREGFEPPDGCPSTVFKTAAFDHSATSPKRNKSITDDLQLILATPVKINVNIYAKRTIGISSGNA
jgi:hypothetical protein